MSRKPSIALVDDLVLVPRRMSALVVLSLLVFALASTEARAVPVACSVPVVPMEDAFPCVQPGNDAGAGGEANVEAGILSRTGVFMDIMAVTDDVTTAPVDFDFDPNDISLGDTFDWEYFGSETLAYATLKASNEFAIFDILGQTSGTLSTVGVIQNINNEPQDISHVIFWKKVGVPEPTSLLLLVAGVFGLGVASRRRR